MANKIKLWDETTDHTTLPCHSQCSLAPYNLSDGENFPAMIICPGGGYRELSNQEGTPVAGWLNSLGISAFNLEYTIEPIKNPFQPYYDIRRAIQYIRLKHKEFNIDPDRVGVIGFSAGGHLAATLATLFKVENPFCDDEIEKISAKPQLAVLSYPVISLCAKYQHLISKEIILRDSKDSITDEITLSLEKQVTDDTPPTFIWHTAEDEIVPVQNSIDFASSLAKNKVPFELHIFPEGKHGLGLCSLDFRRRSHVAKWKMLCKDWLYKYGF